MSIRHLKTGQFRRMDSGKPFESASDERLTLLARLADWLEAWQTSAAQSGGGLSAETSSALIHTIRTRVSLIVYLIKVKHFSFVLTGKVQTDNLEGRFGAYRRMSGCNYNVTFAEIIQSERKLRISSLLKLHSKKFGEISIRDYLADFDEGKAPTVTEAENKFVNDSLVAFEELDSVPDSEQRSQTWLS